MSALRRNLAEFLPEVRLVEPLMSALGGAYRLGRKHLGEDLSREEIESLATQFAETDPQVEGFV